MSKLTYYARKSLELKSEAINITASTPSNFKVNGYSVASAGNTTNLESTQALSTQTIVDDSFVAVTFSGSFSNTNPMLSVVGDTVVLAAGFKGTLDVDVIYDLSEQCNFRVDCIQNPGSLDKGKVTISSPPTITAQGNRGLFHFPLFYSTPLVSPVNLSFVARAKNTTALPDPQVSGGSVRFHHTDIPV